MIPIYVTGHDAPGKRAQKATYIRRPKQGQLALIKCSRQTTALAMNQANLARESESLAREPTQSMSRRTEALRC